jgi:type IV pilus assembly protein PilE
MNASFHRMRTPARGFTLIELIIAVAIVGILASVAWPSYVKQVQKTRRADGKAALLDTAQRLERCHTRFGRYDSDDCDVELPLDSPEAWYSIDVVGSLNPASFTLAATPQGAQADDDQCGVLRLTSSGLQGSQDEDTDEKRCW